LGGPAGFGAGLLDPAERSRREPRSGRSADAERATGEEERPRGFGRRSGSRTRDRGGDEPREAAAEIGWGAEPAAPSSRRGPRAATEAPPVSEPLSGGKSASGGEAPRAALDDDAEGPSRRRSRRRGQRQVLAEAGLDPQQLEESPAETQADD